MRDAQLNSAEKAASSKESQQAVELRRAKVVAAYWRLQVTQLARTTEVDMISCAGRSRGRSGCRGGAPRVHGFGK